MKITFTKFALALCMITGMGMKAQLSAGFFTVSTASDNAASATYTWMTPSIGNVATMLNVPPGQTTSGLRLTNFGFNIPTGCTILGVEAILTFSTSGGAAKDSVIRLTLNNNDIGNNLGGTHTFAPIITTFTYGTSSSTWGTTLTPADVNSPTFGFMCRLKSSGNTALYTTMEKSTQQLAKMKVYYDNFTGVIESQTSTIEIFSYNKSIYLKEALTERSELTVFNLAGQKVYHTIVEPTQTEVNLSELPQGIYVYKLKAGKNEISQKIKLD